MADWAGRSDRSDRTGLRLKSRGRTFEAQLLVRGIVRGIILR